MLIQPSPHPASLAWIETSDPADRRGQDRRPTRLAARVRSGRIERQQVIVLDLSVTGCRVRSDCLGRGDVVSITLGNLESKVAVVMWVKDDEAGIEFNERLHPAVVAHLAIARQ